MAALMLKALLVTVGSSVLVLSRAVKTHAVPIAFAVTPVNVAVPAEAVTVVVPVSVHVPDVTDMVIESAALGEIPTVIVGLKAWPVVVFVG